MVAREIESIGIPTVTFNLISEIVPIVGIPRVISIKNPFGCTVGKPNEKELQLEVIKRALEFVNGATKPKEVINI